MRKTIIRYAIDIPVDTHRDIKLHSFLAKESMKAYILRAIAERQKREQLLVKYIDRPIDEA